MASEDRALADFIKNKLGFGSAVTKELRDAGITSLQALISDGHDVVKRTKLSPVVQRRILQVVDHSGKEFLRRCEQEDEVKAKAAAEAIQPDSNGGSNEASTDLPLPPAPQQEAPIPPPAPESSVERKVMVYVKRCTDLAEQCQETGKRAQALIAVVLQRTADIESACTLDPKSVAGMEAAEWCNEIQLKLKEAEITVNKLSELHRKMEENWSIAEKAEDGPISAEVGQLLSRASLTTSAVDQIRSEVRRKYEEAQSSAARVMSLCTRIEVEDLMLKAEKVASEFKGKADSVHGQISELARLADEVAAEAARNDSDRGTRVQDMVRELGRVKAKTLAIEREVVKPVIKARIKGLSKVRSTKESILQEDDTGEWKHCIKQMRRLDRAANEVHDQYEKLSTSVEQVTSRVQEACRQLGISLADMVSLPPREKSSIVRLNPPESGLLASIEGLLQGSSSTAAIIRASTTGELDLVSLPPGTYSLKISVDAEPPIPLHQAEVQVTVQGAGRTAVTTVEPSVLELPATPMVFGFRKADQPFTDATVKATFVPRSDNIPHNIHLTTDDRGDARILLPAGTILSGMVATKAKEEVRQQHEVVVPQPTVLAHSEALRRSMYTIIANQCTGFQEIVGLNDHVSMAVILGDISGSMLSGTKLKSLKRSMEHIYKDCVNRRIPVGLLAWNAWVWKCPVSTITEINPEAEQWIEGLTPAGCNDMRYTLEETVRLYPMASDIYVICDGDTCPFCIRGGKAPTEDVPRPDKPDIHAVKQPYRLTNWLAFRQRYPQKRFHFIALKEGADSKNLQHMAAIGGGDFYEDM